MSSSPDWLQRERERVEERETVLRERIALRRQLLIAISASCVYFVLVGAGSLLAILLLLDHTRSDDLGRVAGLALAGGALGATVRALYEVMDKLEFGRWELADGTLISRDLRRSAHARRQYLAYLPVRPEPPAEESRGQQAPNEEQAPSPRSSQERLSKEDLAKIEAAEQERVALGLTRAEYVLLRQAEEDAAHSWGFSVYDLPLLILLPMLGAALGLVAFAGFVGGFLVASGSSSPTYSPPGLLFIAALAGMFAPNFIAALSRAADAIFGKTSEPPAPARRPEA
jgi:hypothetical protein